MNRDYADSFILSHHEEHDMKCCHMLVCFLLILPSALAEAQWVQTAGPEGGAIFALFADGANLYAGTQDAGVYRSTDGGGTWEQKINGMGYQATTVIGRSGTNLLASGTVGLYLSTDNGDSWTAATGLPAGNGVSCLAMIGSNVFAGTMGKGVFASTDNGATWSASNTGLPGGGVGTGVGSIAAIGTTLLTSATNNNILGPMYRSTDMGASWTLANTGLPSAYFQYDALYSDGSTVYAGGTQLYKTTNSGDSWSEADNGIPQYSGISCIKASGQNVFASAAYYMYRSTDGGASWAPLGGGLPFENMASVEIAGSVMYAGTIADGVYRSTDNGTSWAARNTRLKARDMNNFLSDGAALYANGNGIFKTTDDGSSWISVRGNLKDSSSQPTALYVSDPLLLERDYPVDGLERSGDNGATWTQAGGGLGSFSMVGAIASTGSALLAADGRVYRSTDGGFAWRQVDTAVTGFVSFGGLEKAGSTIYAYGSGVIKSTDDGTTWTKADSGIAAFFGIAGFASVGSNLFAGGGFPNAIYKSTNGGAFWAKVTALPSGGATSQLLGLGNNLFACSPNNGIFISTNLGASWSKISAGLPNTNYQYSLAIQNGWMFAGTGGNSVWKRPLSDVSAVEEVAGLLPASFSLEQNYPNPFNPSTRFRFRLSEPGFVKLSVVDVLGREVATLVHEGLHAGTYQADWNADGLSTGVYYYRLEQGSSAIVRKMLFTK
jgi:hypothetical protein